MSNNQEWWPFFERAFKVFEPHVGHWEALEEAGAYAWAQVGWGDF